MGDANDGTGVSQSHDRQIRQRYEQSRPILGVSRAPLRRMLPTLRSGIHSSRTAIRHSMTLPFLWCSTTCKPEARCLIVCPQYLLQSSLGPIIQSRTHRLSLTSSRLPRLVSSTCRRPASCHTDAYPLHAREHPPITPAILHIQALPPSHIVSLRRPQLTTLVCLLHRNSSLYLFLSLHPSTSYCLLDCSIIESQPFRLSPSFGLIII
ncbi:hypothetical protein GGR57DRAFT_204117 [Xylariaceae sp. FL1272]|nr:hypothetical protein GGR57DRAFT_204117 [Xylariaceae sp. FL1272]